MELGEEILLPEPSPDDLEEKRVGDLAAAIAETCGHNLAVLATLTNGKAAKHAEIMDYARRLADLTIPAHWCEDDSMAGPITPAHIGAFRDWWQSARPVGNAKDDLPHPVQVYERICTRDAIRHITAHLAAQRRYTVRENAVALYDSNRPSAPAPVPTAPDDQPADTEAARLWSIVLTDLSLSLQHAVFDNYLRPTRAATFHDGVFTITAPNPFVQEWVSVRMHGMIKNRLQALTGTGPIALHVQLAS